MLGKRKIKGGPIGDGGRPFRYGKKRMNNKQKLHYFVAIWGGCHIFGPFFYPGKKRFSKKGRRLKDGPPVMDGPAHLK